MIRNPQVAFHALVSGGPTSAYLEIEQTIGNLNFGDWSRLASHRLHELRILIFRVIKRRCWPKDDSYAEQNCPRVDLVLLDLAVQCGVIQVQQFRSQRLIAFGYSKCLFYQSDFEERNLLIEIYSFGDVGCVQRARQFSGRQEFHRIA